MNPASTLISVVIPVYKSAASLAELIAAVVERLKECTSAYEIVLVDDGSPDNSWELIEKLGRENSQVKGIQLSRNFGQHPAIIAGLENTSGEWVVVMDADFQDDPAYIPTLFNKAKEGFEIVYARRLQRTDSFSKRIVSKTFYTVFSYLTDATFDGSIGNFGIYSRKAVNGILQMKEPFKVFSLMARWVGFKHASIDVQHGVRRHGKSSYTFSKLLDLAMTIMLTYSQKPLALTVRLGLIISALSFAFVIYNLFAYFTGIIQVVGYASLIASIWMLGGIIIFLIGVVGIYVGKILEGVKNRPTYILANKVNL